MLWNQYIFLFSETYPYKLVFKTVRTMFSNRTTLTVHWHKVKMDVAIFYFKTKVLNLFSIYGTTSYTKIKCGINHIVTKNTYLFPLFFKKKNQFSTIKFY